MNFEYIFWDWKGTIQKGSNSAALFQTLNELKQQNPHLIQIEAKDFKRDYRKASNLRGEEIRKFEEKYVVNFQALESTVGSNLTKSLFFEGALELLFELKQKGFRMSLIRNAQQEKDSFMAFLNKVGVEEVFEEVFLSAETGYKKPDPRVFRLALKKVGKEHVEPKQILFIGNEVEADILGPKQLGWSTCLIRNTEKSSNGLADFEVDTFSQLRPILGL
eukprot:TRINITY_DN4262_c0_g1_i1.p1 TRINITY_DN4262_c0_g1~~TRINITY_DN4262_c0_g1_i1.p1  ORF type:complete len:219 (+),score=58.62 TRINITY_DN4262_c0_g1_i1:129-785(+)